MVPGTPEAWGASSPSSPAGPPHFPRVPHPSKPQPQAGKGQVLAQQSNLCLQGPDCGQDPLLVPRQGRDGQVVRGEAHPHPRQGLLLRLTDTSKWSVGRWAPGGVGSGCAQSSIPLPLPSGCSPWRAGGAQEEGKALPAHNPPTVRDQAVVPNVAFTAGTKVVQVGGPQPGKGAKAGSSGLAEGHPRVGGLGRQVPGTAHLALT